MPTGSMTDKRCQLPHSTLFSPRLTQSRSPCKFLGLWTPSSRSLRQVALIVHGDHQVREEQGRTEGTESDPSMSHQHVTCLITIISMLRPIWDHNPKDNSHPLFEKKQISSNHWIDARCGQVCAPGDQTGISLEQSGGPCRGRLAALLVTLRRANLSAPCAAPPPGLALHGMRIEAFDLGVQSNWQSMRE